jgi:hypothetical protein
MGPCPAQPPVVITIGLAGSGPSESMVGLGGVAEGSRPVLLLKSRLPQPTGPYRNRIRPLLRLLVARQFSRL